MNNDRRARLRLGNGVCNSTLREFSDAIVVVDYLQANSKRCKIAFESLARSAVGSKVFALITAQHKELQDPSG